MFRNSLNINKIRNQEQLPYYFLWPLAFGEQTLIGILLGDGHLEKTSYGKKANCRLKITFAERYKPLAFYVAGLFCYYINTKGIKFSNVKSSKDSKLYGRVSLTTIARPIFNQFHNLFYKSVLDEEKKEKKEKYVQIIPTNIEEILTEISLAF